MMKTELYEQFWNEFFALSESQISIYSTAKPTHRGSVSLGTKNGLSFWSKIKGTDSHTALYISQLNRFQNEQIFNNLHQHKNEIEESFGSRLIWEKLQGKLPCRIYYRTQIGELKYKKGEWKEIQIEMINSMIRFQKTFSPYLDILPN
jgi:hypothetical protein